MHCEISYTVVFDADDEGGKAFRDIAADKLADMISGIRDGSLSDNDTGDVTAAGTRITWSAKIAPAADAEAI